MSVVCPNGHDVRAMGIDAPPSFASLQFGNGGGAANLRACTECGVVFVVLGKVLDQDNHVTLRRARVDSRWAWSVERHHDPAILGYAVQVNDSTWYAYQPTSRFTDDARIDGAFANRGQAVAVIVRAAEQEAADA